MTVYPDKSSWFTEGQIYWEITTLEFTSDNIFNAKQCQDTFSLNLLFMTKIYRYIIIDIDNADPGTFKELCKMVLKDNFVEKWNASLNHGASSILRTYATFKQTFEMDFHSENVNQFRYRNAITKLRASYHALEIERGRHCSLSVEERICRYCHCIEDEKHFLFHCSIVKEARLLLNTRICPKYCHYTNLNDEQKCFSCLPVTILNYHLGLANSYTLHCDRRMTLTPAYWIIVVLVWKNEMSPSSS